MVDTGYLEPSKLADNEEFVTVIQAMSLSAIKTHNEAKIELLRYAALNVALHPDIYSAELDVLTTLVDDLTVWHVKLLRLLANPEQSPVDHPSSHQERAGVLHPVSLLEVLQAAYPELKQDFPFLQRIYSDLVLYGLASERDFNKGWYIRDNPLPDDNSNNFRTGWGGKVSQVRS